MQVKVICAIASDRPVMYDRHHIGLAPEGLYQSTGAPQQFVLVQGGEAVCITGGGVIEPYDARKWAFDTAFIRVPAGSRVTITIEN